MNKYPPLSKNQERLREELGDEFSEWDQPVPHIYVHALDELPELAERLYREFGSKHERLRQ